MKKVLIIILGAILIGGGLAYIVFNKIVFKEEDTVNTKVVNAFQIGVFSNYDNALKVADRNNGVVIMDDDLYRVYVAILSDKEAIKKRTPQTKNFKSTSSLAIGKVGHLIPKACHGNNNITNIITAKIILAIVILFGKFIFFILSTTFYNLSLLLHFAPL